MAQESFFARGSSISPAQKGVLQGEQDSEIAEHLFLALAARRRLRHLEQVPVVPRSRPRGEVQTADFPQLRL